MRTLARLFLAILVIGAVNPARERQARAQAAGGNLTDQVGFDQRLGARVPLDLRFRDERGRAVRLGEYLGRRPAILALVYYRCPLLCNQVLNGLTRTLRAVALDAGSGFDVVAVSISPEETPELAGQKRAAYLERYDRPGAERGWHFLVGDRGSIAGLARAVGFRYQYNPRTGLYTHAAGIVVLTPDGRVARYFYGIDYPPRELQDELGRAAGGRIGSPIGRLLLLCYDYDAAAGKYTLSIVRLIRVLGTLTALSLGMYLVVMFRRERRARWGDRPSSPAVPVGSSMALDDHL
jgi:protein SCO1/2